jgi:phage baseplate assembly protein W
MAFGQQQIFPIDFNKSAAVGVDIPFSAPGVFYQNYTTAAAIKNNLINYFLTNPGERPLNPLFGAGLRSFIFEQLAEDNLSELEDKIQNDLNIYFPNISILNLEVNDLIDTYTINVKLEYAVNQTNITDTLELNFE